MTKSRRGIVVLLFLCALSPLAAHAATIQFQEGVSPTTAYQSGAVEVRQDLPTQNRNGGTGVNVGVQGFASSTERGLFSFDLSSLHNSGTLTSVSFTLTIISTDSTSGSTPVPVELHLLAGTFDETTVTWNSQPANSTLLSSISAVPNAATGGTITWSSTPAFLAAAQAASNASGALNFAVRLADANEAAQTTRNLFFFGSNDNTTTTLRPQLTVVVPEPASLSPLAIGLPALLARRRKA